MSDRKLKILLYVGLFALLYVAFLIAIGSTLVFLQIETGAWPNIIALIASSSLTGYWFSNRAGHRFSKSEFVVIVIGSIVTDIAVQFSTILYFYGINSLSNKWIGFISILLTNAAVLALSYRFWRTHSSECSAA